MNNKENYLNILNHKKREYISSFFSSTFSVGFGAGPGPWFEKGPQGGGLDGFGVRWITPASGGGAPIPAPGEFLLKDITAWREFVTFPDLDVFDWKAESERDLAACNREQMVVDYGSGNGVFERLAALMGFEEALLALQEEPELCNEFFEAITDYKIKLAEKAAKYYKPDVFTNFDDIATERNLFMSPGQYRELIKPHHTRLNKATVELGMIPIYHCCGKAEAIAGDMIEAGYAAWTSVQPCNDIVSILESYGDRLSIIGGFDSNGMPGRPSATDQEVRAEVRRCLDTYGKYNGYVFFGARIVNTTDQKLAADAYIPIIDEAANYIEKLSQITSNFQILRQIDKNTADI